MNIEELVEKYQRLDMMKVERENEIKKIKEAGEKIKGLLLDHFTANGIKSVKTHLGTVYTSERLTASIADWDVFLTSVIANSNWNLLEHRCSAKAAEEYIEAHDTPPPGVNTHRAVTINIRSK
jgi:hypothetical protein